LEAVSVKEALVVKLDRRWRRRRRMERSGGEGKGVWKKGWWGGGGESVLSEMSRRKVKRVR